MENPDPYPGAQAVARAIALLKTFDDAQPEWGLTELARSAGLNKTTAYRLLKALENEGMLARNPATDAYRLGPEIIALGARALRANDLRKASRPELEALAGQTGETATLEVLAGDQVLILDEAQGHYLIGSSPSLGTRWPVHATSTGKVLLSEMTEAQRKKIVQAPLARLTDKTITTIAALRDELARTRRHGYAVAFDELQVGYVALGAPVRNLDGRMIGAISLGGPSIRLTRERVAGLVPLVKEAARRVSQKLGCSADLPAR